MKTVYNNLESDHQYDMFIDVLKALEIKTTEYIGYPVVEGEEQIKIADCINEYIINNVI